MDSLHQTEYRSISLNRTVKVLPICLYNATTVNRLLHTHNGKVHYQTLLHVYEVRNALQEGFNYHFLVESSGRLYIYSREAFLSSFECISK